MIKCSDAKTNSIIADMVFQQGHYICRHTNGALYEAENNTKKSINYDNKFKSLKDIADINGEYAAIISPQELHNYIVSNPIKLKTFFFAALY